MEPMDPLDAAMVTAEPMSQLQHVAAVLILSPPDDAGPEVAQCPGARSLRRVRRAGRGTYQNDRVVAKQQGRG